MQDQLFAAAESGNRDQVQRLLAAGVDVNAKGRDGLTALMKACLKGHLEVARVLVNAGADVNARDNYGWSRVAVGFIVGARGNAKFCIENGAILEIRGQNYGHTLSMKPAAGTIPKR